MVNFSIFDSPLQNCTVPTEDYRADIIAQIVQRPTVIREYTAPSGHVVKVYSPARAVGSYFGNVHESRRNSRKGAE